MYFLHQIKHTNDSYDKGIVIKETFEAAKQSYHAYLGAYAYGQQPQTDFVSCMISDDSGIILVNETWTKPKPVPVEETAEEVVTENDEVTEEN